jgi:steroid delta-isomerase-like uncharacterized protein
MADAADVVLEAMECWNQKDMAGMRARMHQDYSYTGGDGVQQKGVDAGMAVAEMFANAFPDGKIDVTRVIRAGDGVVVIEFVGRGTHTGDLMGIPPTGRTMEIPVCDVVEVRDGKIYSEHEYMDQMVIMTQLGVAAAPAA